MNIMSPGELAKGQIVTVFANTPTIIQEVKMPPQKQNSEEYTDTVQPLPFKDYKVVAEDRTGIGSILEIVGVQLPFVAVSCISTVDLKRAPAILLDTRKTTFMELSGELLESIVKPNYGHN
jgi:hypothetical protein